MRKKEHDPSQLVIDTTMARNLCIGIFLAGIAAGSDSPLKLADIAAWIHGDTGQLVVSPEEAGRFQEIERDIRDLRHLYRVLQDDLAAADSSRAQAWRSDARHEARQDTSIRNLEEEVGELSEGP